MRRDVSAADMIAMIGAGAVQTPRGQPMADKFPCPRRKLSTSGVDALWTADMDKLPRSGRKPLRGAFIRPTGANAAYWGRRWSARTGFCVRDETVQRGACPAFRGQ